MGATTSSRGILLFFNYLFRQEPSQATFPPWKGSLGRGLQRVQGEQNQIDRTADQTIPLPSQEHRATQKQDGMKAVSSIATTSFADHFFPAVIWDSLISSPGTLQPKKGSPLEASLIQGSQGALSDSFSKSRAFILSCYVFPATINYSFSISFSVQFNKLQRN